MLVFGQCARNLEVLLLNFSSISYSLYHRWQERNSERSCVLHWVSRATYRVSSI